MTQAAKLLILGGVLNLALAFVLGFILSARRLRDPARDEHWLLNAHRVALQEGFMLLALVFAVLISPLSNDLELIAVALLVAASVLQDASSVMNWVQGVGDQFVAPRRSGYAFAAINSVLAAGGLAILVVGVIRGV